MWGGLWRPCCLSRSWRGYLNVALGFGSGLAHKAGFEIALPQPQTAQYDTLSNIWNRNHHPELATTAMVLKIGRVK